MKLKFDDESDKMIDVEKIIDSIEKEAWVSSLQSGMFGDYTNLHRQGRFFHLLKAIHFKIKTGQLSPHLTLKELAEKEFEKQKEEITFCKEQLVKQLIVYDDKIMSQEKNKRARYELCLVSEHPLILEKNKVYLLLKNDDSLIYMVNALYKQTGRRRVTKSELEIPNNIPLSKSILPIIKYRLLKLTAEQSHTIALETGEEGELYEKFASQFLAYSEKLVYLEKNALNEFTSFLRKNSSEEHKEDSTSAPAFRN